MISDDEISAKLQSAAAYHVEKNVDRYLLELFDGGNDAKNKTHEHDDKPVTRTHHRGKLSTISNDLSYYLFFSQNNIR